MLLARTKVEPRNNPQRKSLLKGFKSKTSLPQTCSSAQAVFEHMKLTQSQQIQAFQTNEFQLNILPPPQSFAPTEPITKKFCSPEWLIASNMASSYSAHEKNANSQNPENRYECKHMTENDYENSQSQSEKTESQRGNNDLLVIDNSEIQRILEMTVSDDKERQFNETNLKSAFHFNQQLEAKSTLFCNPNSADSDKANQTTLEVRQLSEKSAASQKPKSAIIRPSQNLQEFHKRELQMFSEYGLKPYEQNRLRKIQQFEKLQLLKEQADNIEANEAYENQEYFNQSKSKKTGREMAKFRKSSAVVQICANQKSPKDVPKKSMSKNKHSLSKGKKAISPKLMVKKN